VINVLAALRLQSAGCIRHDTQPEHRDTKRRQHLAVLHAEMVKLTELVEAEFGSIVDERAHRCFGPFAARILRLDMKVWFVEVALESGERCWESLVH
jgi:hypothetical protein